MTLFIGAIVGVVTKVLPAIVSGKGILSAFINLGKTFLGPISSLLGGPAGLIARGIGGLLGNVLGKIFPFPKNLPFGLGDLGGILRNVFDIFKKISSGNFGGLLKKALDIIGTLIKKAVGDKGGLGKGCHVFDLIKKLFPGIEKGVTTPGTTKPQGGGDKALLDAASKAYDQMNSIEKQIQNLDPNDPNYQKKLMQLQFKMQKIMQMIQMITQLLRMKHDMSMQIIRNIRY